MPTAAKAVHGECLTACSLPEPWRRRRRRQGDEGDEAQMAWGKPGEQVRDARCFQFVVEASCKDCYRSADEMRCDAPLNRWHLHCPAGRGGGGAGQGAGAGVWAVGRAGRRDQPCQVRATGILLALGFEHRSTSRLRRQCHDAAAGWCIMICWMPALHSPHRRFCACSAFQYPQRRGAATPGAARCRQAHRALAPVRVQGRQAAGRPPARAPVGGERAGGWAWRWLL